VNRGINGHEVVRRGLTVALAITAACTRAAPPPEQLGGIPLENIENCRRLYGLPSRFGDHSELTRCLVDRYGAGPKEADVAALLYVLAQYRQLDSLMALREAEALRERDSLRQVRDRAVRAERERLQGIQDSMDADRATRTLLAERDRKRSLIRIELATENQFDTLHLDRGYFISRDIIKGVYNGLREPVSGYKVIYRVEDTDRQWIMNFPADSVTIGTGVYRVQVQIGQTRGDHDVLVALHGSD
jgi:hypothetical protein